MGWFCTNRVKMKKIITILLLAAAHTATAQTAADTIQLHYKVLDSLWNKKNYSKVIDYAKQAAPYFEKNNKYPYFYYYKLLVKYTARAYREKKLYAEAEKIILGILPAIERTSSRLYASYRDAAYELAQTYSENGRYTKAYDYCLLAWKSYPLWYKLQPWLYIQISTDLIGICTSLGKYKEGALYLKKVEESMTVNKYDAQELTDLNIVAAILYTQMMSLQKAAWHIEKAAELLPQTDPNIFTKTEIANVQALILAGAGNTAKGKSVLLYMLKELDSLKMKKNDAYSYTIGNLASIMLVQNAARQGDSLLTAFLSEPGLLKNKFTGMLFVNLALFKAQQVDYTKALSCMDTALSWFAAYAGDELQINLPVALLRPVLLLKMGSAATAWPAYQKAMAYFTGYIKTNISNLSETEKNGLTYSYYNMANFAPSFITTGPGPDDDSLITKCWEQALYYRGLAAGEQGRLYRALQQSTDTALRILFNDWQQLKQFLHAEYKKPAMLRLKDVDSMAVAADNKEKQLLLYLPGKKDDDAGNKVEQIYKHLQPGEALIDFTRYSRITNALVDSVWYGAFVLRYGKPAPLFYNLCAEELLAGLCSNGGKNPGRLINMLYPSATFRQNASLPGHRIYKLIWQPLKAALKNVSTVYIVADGLLHKIAFAALPAGRQLYLADKIHIRCLYHAGSICSDSFRLHKKPAGVQIWGGIDYEKTDELPAAALPVNDNPALGETAVNEVELNWEFLPGARAEAGMLKKICAATNTPYALHTGSSATETLFKQNLQPGFDIVHIATHGRYDSGYFSRRADFSQYANMPFTLQKDPMQQAGLVMAGRNCLKYNEGTTGSDGMLQAAEIAQLNLGNKQLVVLSACETGLGDIISTEGVFGMARAFKMAGAGKILISLWPVDDAVTREMMQQFYTRFFQTPDASSALKTAQQYMRKRYPPYYWAGFVLIE
jgi:CHAT domain-containing protein